jgi:hypothetical protein
MNYTKDVEKFPMGIVLAGIGDRMLWRFPFSLKMAASILTDKLEPVSVRTIRSWTTGELLTIKPTRRIEGQKRLAFGFHDLWKFLIAKQLLRGPSPLPSVGVQVFIDHWQKPEFLKGIPFEARMQGTFLLYQDPDDSGQLEIHFLAQERSNLSAAIEQAIGKGGKQFRILEMESIFQELLLRLYFWLESEPFPISKLQWSKPMTAEEFLEIGKIISDLRRRVNECEPVLSSMR